MFQRVYTTRKTVSTDLITMHVLPRQPKSLAKPPLVGFVIGKKAHAKASRRNFAKRKVREAYRLLRLATEKSVLETEPTLSKDLNLEQWYAIVFVIHAKTLEASWESIQESVKFCLQKANDKFGVKRSARQSS